ncbi:HGGxSTG domain-containing protein [Pseudosulfitobacter pseudonitzschiae]|uniref:HGGxSTG domain-containing protein n=1 Tax=Pseudosulfitobacter pseudonitzschiae TaxID=1402135 RepID=UPI002ED98489
MINSLRCGAKTRKGTPCRAPAVSGKVRCRMHGGAAGSGAPKGNKNALKNGLYTAEAIEMRQLVRNFSQKTKDIIEDM